MAKEPSKKLKRVTPRGIAAFAHLDKPDTKGQYADDKYKVTLKLEKGVDANEAFVKEMRALVKETVEKQKEAWSKKKLESFDPIKDGDDSEHEGDHGFWKITFKSKNQPDMVDASKKKLPEKIKIYSGDVIKVAYGYQPFEKPVQSKGGISLYLNAVQLLEKNAGGFGADAFDEEEGFTSRAGEADDKEDDAAEADADEAEVEENTDEKPKKAGGKGAGKSFDF